MALLGTRQTKAIDEKAEVLLESVFGSIEDVKLPIDLDRVVEYCGLTLKQGDFKDDNIAAALDRGSNTIYLAAGDGQNRQSFSIAHELGHYKLHTEVATDVFYRNQATYLLSEEDGVRETEANWFAASLLMPEELIKKFWKVLKDVEGLAKIFGVSPTAMRYRLKHLGMIK